MAYVITGTCTKDEHCIDTCPVNCIHPTKDEPDFATAAQLYVSIVVRASASAQAPRFSISRYLRAKRSKSAICRSISSRAASAAERMPWIRSLNSSAFDARESASSNVINSLV
jgi:formate hydrogenlyase subunit 6/NADH:ubiquinone oxidoreductase subunit I